MQWKLFPFSLTERAEQWYTRTIGSMSGDWEELRDYFCYSFSLTECIDSLPTDILDFEQLEEESMGAAWARFLCLLASNPDMSRPEDVSLNIFCSGLHKESAPQTRHHRRRFVCSDNSNGRKRDLRFSLSKLFLPYQSQRTHPTRVRVVRRGASSS